jgi:hypothetical protein
MTPEVRDQSILPPPEPPDPAGTRPPLDLLGMWCQVVLIQLGIERRVKAKEQAAEQAVATAVATAAKEGLRK